MGDVKVTGTTINIPIKEAPLGDGRFYIRDKWLKLAREKGKKLILEYQGQKYMATYKQWMEGAKKMKKEFLIEGCPMILWGNFYKKFPYREELGEVSVLGALGNMPEEYRLQIRAKLGVKSV